MRATFQRVRSKGNATTYQEVGTPKITRRMLSLDNETLVAKRLASHNPDTGFIVPERIRVTIDSA